MKSFDQLHTPPPISSVYNAQALQFPVQRQVSFTLKRSVQSQDPSTSKHISECNESPLSKQLKCTLCNFVAKGKNELIIHSRSHSEGMHFTCSFCSYKTVYKNNLKSHMRKHTGEYKFFCEFCPYKAKHRTAFIYHLANTHNMNLPAKKF